MSAALDKTIASKLAIGLERTPAVSPQTLQGFTRVLEAIQRPDASEAEAEAALREWMEAAQPHAASVVRAIVLGMSYQKKIERASWLYRAVTAKG
jgi:hypothetical protein